ncbi:MAG: alpha/beta hydrolase [Victivallales bacterium]|jgi:exosortase A-associated hydrolase 2
MIQEPFFINGGNSQLYSVLFMPEKDFSNKVFLFCHPLFEEKKASHRVLVDLARKLADNGYASLMLDFQACGDSGGTVQDFIPSNWLEDIRTGIKWLQERFEKPRTNLLGIRFGATLAVEFAVGENGIEDLILIDPVVQGKSYLGEILQQKYIREMMTFGEARSDVNAMSADLERNGQLDIDGTMVSSAFFDAVKTINISKQDLSSFKRILLIQQSPRKSLLPAYEDLQRKCRDGNVNLEISLLTVPPFWKAVDMADSETVCKSILPWCR